MNGDDRGGGGLLKGISFIAGSFVAQPPQQSGFKNAGQVISSRPGFLFVSKLYATSDEHHLCSCALPVPTSPALNDHDIGDYTKVAEKFDSYFVHRVNALHESAHFLRRILINPATRYGWAVIPPVQLNL